MIKKIGVFFFAFIALSTAFGDTIKHSATPFLGQWRGTGKEVSYKSLRALHGKLDQAIFQVKSDLNIHSATDGFCLVSEKFKILNGKHYGGNNMGTPISKETLHDMLCGYDDDKLYISEHSGAQWTCTLNLKQPTEMTCLYIRSSDNHQAILKLVYKKISNN